MLMKSFLVVDDEKEVHDVTRIALANLKFESKRIKFLYAFSGEEARKIIQKHPDIAGYQSGVVLCRSQSLQP